jgi:predicted HTH transcriptional regulator
MERGVVQSKLRNPVLAGLLRDIPGYMERIGSGIRFMLDETRRLKLPAPHFQETGEFVVAFAQAPDLTKKPSSQSQPHYGVIASFSAFCTLRASMKAAAWKAVRSSSQNACRRMLILGQVFLS